MNLIRVSLAAAFNWEICKTFLFFCRNTQNDNKFVVVYKEESTISFKKFNKHMEMTFVWEYWMDREQFLAVYFKAEVAGQWCGNYIYDIKLFIYFECSQ